MLIKPTEVPDSDKNCLALHFFFFIRAFCFLFITLYLTSETISSNELLKFSYYLSQSFCCTTETFGQGEKYPLAARNSLLKENWNTQNKDPLKKHSLAGCFVVVVVVFKSL